MVGFGRRFRSENEESVRAGSQEPEVKSGGNADDKLLPASAKSTKIGRQAAGSETTIDDTQPCVPIPGTPV